MAVAGVVKGYFSFTVAADVLTITAVGVTKVRFPKAATPGAYVVLDLTGKSYSVDFNTYPVNAGCGLTTTVNWANAMPWFVYLGNEDDTAANIFAFNTRDPRMVVTPAAGLINDTDAVGATAQSQNHINSFKADDAGIAAKPCICIGSHTMTWDTADDRWTLVALTTADGFGRFQEGVMYNFPAGQNGCATAGMHFDESGAATSLAFNTPVYKYTLGQDGFVDFYYTTGTRSASDASATVLYFYLPLSSATTNSDRHFGRGLVLYNNNALDATYLLTGGTGVASIRATGVSGLTAAGFANANDNIHLEGRYVAF